MRYMTLVKSPENSGPPPKALMDAIGKLGEQAAKAGTLVQMGGLMPSFMGARVRLTKDQLIVKDGPFTETKELVGGFAVYEVNSKEEAIEATKQFLELHRRHWPGWEGEVEVRQIYEG